MLEGENFYRAENRAKVLMKEVQTGRVIYTRLGTADGVSLSSVIVECCNARVGITAKEKTGFGCNNDASKGK